MTAIATIALVGCKKNDPEIYDNIIVYGTIYTAEVDATKTPSDNGYYKMASAMVVKNGKFEYVGKKAGADAYKTENSLIINQDVLKCDVNMIRNTKVLKTFFEGKECGISSN